MAGVLMAAMSVVWALGGFDKAPEAKPRVFEPGRKIDQGIFKAEVVRAFDAGLLKPGDPMAESRGITESRRILGLDMRVENLDDKSADPVDYVGTTSHEDGEMVLVPRMKVRVGADGYLQYLTLSVRRPDRPEEFFLPPDVEVRFRTVWLLPADAEPPGDITVELTDYEPRATVFYDIPDYWLPEVEQDPDAPLGGERERQAPPKMAYQIRTPVEEGP